MKDTIVSLLAIPKEQRELVWQTRFYQAVQDALLIKGERFTGPDGFEYTATILPSTQNNAEGSTIEGYLDTMLAEGTGLVLFDQHKNMLWVFSYGNLRSLKEYGSFSAPSESSSMNRDARIISKGEKILTGQPSEHYFPLYARKAVREYLEKQGIHGTKLFLMDNPSLQPTQSLIFSLYKEDFPDEQKYNNIMQGLSWFFGPSFGVISISKLTAEQFQAAFQPL